MFSRILRVGKEIKVLFTLNGMCFCMFLLFLNFSLNQKALKGVCFTVFVF